MKRLPVLSTLRPEGDLRGPVATVVMARVIAMAMDMVME